MATRVLWVTKGLGPGGAERLLCAAAKAHDRSHFEIECAYVLPWKDHLAEELETAGVPTHCLSARRGDLRWPLRLWRLVRSGDWDIVHVHAPLPGSVARLAVRAMPRTSRPAVVQTAHNRPSTYTAPTRLADALTSRWDAATIAVSDEVLEDLPPTARRRATALVHGIDVEAVVSRRTERDRIRQELGLAPDDIVAVTVANFRPQKDYPNLLQAARILADQDAPVRIVAVGQGPDEAEVRHLATDLQLEERVVLTGFRPDAVDVLAAGDIFVLASRWEGLPVAAMEATALGLPIVSTSVGGMAEAFTNDVDAVLVPPADPAVLADALTRVAADDTLRARLARTSTAKAAEFDAAASVRSIETIYNRVTPDRAPTEPSAAATPSARKPARRGTDLELRAATPDDRAAVLDICRSALRWGEDPRYAELFSWKHDDNAFGPSYAWVAVDGDRLVGVRVFLRWEFVRNGEVLRAVRAVDTATHPDYQGRGLFTALTMHGLDEVRADGVDFVFNTPNEKSRPGYLKMGWQTVGRFPAALRPVGARDLLALRTARVPASHWAEPSEVGRSAGAAMDTVVDAAAATPRPANDVRTIQTHTTPDYLRWRYGGPLGGFRVVENHGGIAIVQFRRRGGAVECDLVEWFGLNLVEAERLAVDAARQHGAQVVVRTGAADPARGFLGVPGGGPVMTWRSVNAHAMPPLANWDLTMGTLAAF